MKILSGIMLLLAFSIGANAQFDPHNFVANAHVGATDDFVGIVN